MSGKNHDLIVRAFFAWFRTGVGAGLYEHWPWSPRLESGFMLSAVN